jgi:hypothetical protein
MYFANIASLVAGYPPMSSALHWNVASGMLGHFGVMFADGLSFGGSVMAPQSYHRISSPFQTGVYSNRAGEQFEAAFSPSATYPGS